MKIFSARFCKNWSKAE